MILFSQKWISGQNNAFLYSASENITKFFCLHFKLQRLLLKDYILLNSDYCHVETLLEYCVLWIELLLVNHILSKLSLRDFCLN